MVAISVIKLLEACHSNLNSALKYILNEVKQLYVPNLFSKLTFTENPVESSFAKTNLDFSGEYRSPRRSLDLSLIADQLPPMVDEKVLAFFKS